MKDKIKNLGQVFTPERIVEEMLALRRNKGAVLEPACGDGAFLAKLPASSFVTGVETDESLAAAARKRSARFPHRRRAVVLSDFFAYPVSRKFDTIIGNPPYVRCQDIPSSTKKRLSFHYFDRRTNLYLFFIEKCLRHLRTNGEMILITPRDFLKATSARKLNEELYRRGSITYFRELGDEAVFAGYSPNCAVWRYQKDFYDRRLPAIAPGEERQFNYFNGQLWIGPQQSGPPKVGPQRGAVPRGDPAEMSQQGADPAIRGKLSDFFDVKVGAVSGADSLFLNEKRGNADMVFSATAQTGKTRRMIYNRKDKSLFPYKRELMRRKIRPFNESNWWEWGRKYCERDQERVYVNCKTRNPKPFFTHSSREYDGAVMALFPKKTGADVQEAAARLNSIDWAALGFECGGRLLFTQRSLSNAPISFSMSLGEKSRACKKNMGRVQRVFAFSLGGRDAKQNAKYQKGNADALS